MYLTKATIHQQTKRFTLKKLKLMDPRGKEGERGREAKTLANENCDELRVNKNTWRERKRLKLLRIGSEVLQGPNPKHLSYVSHFTKYLIYSRRINELQL